MPAGAGGGHRSGDSNAAGYAAEGYQDQPCTVTPGAYHSMVAGDLGAKLNARGWGGFRSHEMRHLLDPDWEITDWEYADNCAGYVQYNDLESRRDIYIQAVEEADLITVNIGSNDILGNPLGQAMREGFARHGFFDLSVKAEGDLIVDCHHTIEDTGIVLGNAIKKAVGDKKGIKRYGSCILPMDETLVLCAVDLSGRPYLSFDGNFTVERVGYMDTEMVKEFFYAISYTAGMNLHIKVLTPGNNHHMIEAMFKAFARALDEATSYDPRITDILSTKGSL